MNDPLLCLQWNSFQIEEINFRDDDISAEMIPVPQKKGRGRPRKYLRLEDVLEWRQQNRGGQETEKAAKESSSDNQAEDIKKTLQVSEQNLLVKESDSSKPLQQKQKHFDVSSFDSNESPLKVQQDNENIKLREEKDTVENSNTIKPVQQQQQHQQQLVIESNVSDIDEWNEDNCESVQEETIVDETIMEVGESHFDHFATMTSLKDSDESVTLYGGLQGVNVINNFLLSISF